MDKCQLYEVSTALYLHTSCVLNIIDVLLDRIKQYCLVFKKHDTSRDVTPLNAFTGLILFLCLW